MGKGEARLSQVYRLLLCLGSGVCPKRRSNPTSGATPAATCAGAVGKHLRSDCERL
jgi:hypothetical protein